MLLKIGFKLLSFGCVLFGVVVKDVLKLVLLVKWILSFELFKLGIGVEKLWFELLVLRVVVLFVNVMILI